MACSNGERAEQVIANPKTAPVFGAEEKAAARALSVGSDSMAQTDAQPYAQALLCQVALEAVAEPLRQSGRLSAEQTAGVEQLIAFYERRVQSLSTGKSEAELRLETEKYRAQAEATVSRTAFACLRKLQLDN